MTAQPPISGAGNTGVTQSPQGPIYAPQIATPGAPNDQWRIDVLECEISILDERIDQAISILLNQDVAYGLSAVGVVQLLNVLRGESDASMEGQLP